MDRYLCVDCLKTFRYFNINDDSDSDLVNLLTARCPYCTSYQIDLTKHGKLLIERQRKIEKINQIVES